MDTKTVFPAFSSTVFRLVGAMLFVLVSAQVFAATITAKLDSDGTKSSSNWGDGVAWVGNVAPVAGDVVIIPANATINLTGQLSTDLVSITVQGTLNLGLNIINNTTTTYSNNFELDGGTLQVGHNLGLSGSISNSGAQVFTSGTIEFVGPGAQNFGVRGGLTNIDVIANSGNTVSLDGDVTFKDLTISSGAFDLDAANTLTLLGDFSRSGGTFTHSNRKVLMAGSAQQTIGGTQNTTFRDLEIDNSAGVVVGRLTTIAGVLTLTDGNVSIGNNDLRVNGSLANGNNISNFSNTNMIVTDGTGVLRINVGNGDYAFPVGNGTDYTPAFFGNIVATPSGTERIELRVVDAKAGSNTSVGDYLTRYWEAELFNFTATCDPAFTYVASDIIGTEADIKGALNDGAWTLMNTANSNVIDGSGVSLAETLITFTGVESVAPSVTSVLVSDATLSDPDDTNTFTVQVTYDEEMQTATTPTVTFSNISGELSFTGGAWSNGNKTYTASYTINDTGDDELGGTDITIDSGKDLLGTVQNLYTENAAFIYKFSNPTVTGIVADPTTITDADIGANAFDIEVTFSEAMDPGVNPVISFPTPGEDPTSTFSSSTQAWSGGDAVCTETYTVADNNDYILDIDVRVTNAEDTYGNLVVQYDETNVFNVDMSNPTVVSCTPSTTLITDAEVGNNTFTITLVFDKDMDTANPQQPTVSFPTEDPTNTVTSPNGVWQADDRTIIFTYDIDDIPEEIDDVDIRVTGGRDVNANNHIGNSDFADQFSIDTQNPSVTSLIPSLTEITDSDAGAGKFKITVNFSEDMDTGVTPTVGFDAENPLGTISFASGSWTNATQYVATYNVTDNNQLVTDVDVLVSNAQDVAGNIINPAVDGNFDNEFTIDMENPTVTSVTESISTITDTDAGGSFTLTIVFSHAVNSAPTVTLTPDVSSTLTLTSTSALPNTTVVMTYSITDANVGVSGIDVDVESAVRANGNAQVDDSFADVFNIDMGNAAVDDVTSNIARVIDSHVGSGTLALTVTFNKVMDMGTDPTLTFPTGGENPLADGTLTYNAGTSTWTNSTTFVAYYNVADNDLFMEDIDVRVDGAQDASANGQTPRTVTDVFSIEMNEPNITGIVANDPLLTDADVGTGTYTLTITYDKDMQTTVAPNIQFQNPLDGNTLAFYAGGSSWQDVRTYLAAYTVSDKTVEIDDIDVYVSGSNVRDAAGNAPNAYTEADLLDVDTKNPSATAISPEIATVSVTNITDTEVGSTFDLEITFDEDMTQNSDITITFPVENPLSTLTRTGEVWDDATHCRVQYSITDAGDKLSNIDVQVENASDAQGNVMNSKYFFDVFNIDMENPDVTAMSIASNNANNTSLAKSGDDVVVTFTVNRALASLPTVTIAGETDADPDVTVSSLGGLTYEARITLDADEPETAVAFTINLVDPNGNTGTVTEADITDASSVTCDFTAPDPESPQILSGDLTEYGGISITIASSGNANNKVWFAPAGQTTEAGFSAGTTMTEATNGLSTSILSPANEGDYHIYVIDEAGNVSVASARILTVDNTPILSGIEGTGLTWTEGDAALQITNTLLVEDDSDNIVSATVTISSNYDASGDVLNFTNTVNITGSYAGGVLTLNGPATRTEFTNALRAVTFESTSELPAEGAANIRTIDFRINDGFENSNIEQRQITVVEVNDPPVITSIAITIGRDGEVYTYDFDATDADDVIGVGNITISTNPGWLSAIAGGTGIAQITGTAAQPPRDNPVQITLADGRGGVDVQDYIITVSAAVQVNPNGGADYTSIQEAIDNATSGDKILLQEADYYESFVYPTNKDIYIEGVGNKSNVILHPSLDNDSAVVTFANSSNDQWLSNVTVTDGVGNKTNWAAQTAHGQESRFGGGINITAASPTIDNCIIRDNIIAYDEDSHHGGSGAGIYIGRNSSATIQNTLIENNESEVYRGGGVCVDNSTATFNNCIVQDNKAGSYGGGFAVFHSTVTFTSVTVTGNTVSSAHSEGGGVYLHHSTLTITGGSVSGNSATLNGNDTYAHSSTVN